MTAWIISLITAAVSPVRVAIAEIVARFTSLWATVTGFWSRTRDELARWIGLARSWALAGGRYVGAAYTVARYIITWLVPHGLAVMADQIVSWAVEFVTGLVNDVRAELGIVRDWFISTVNNVIRVLSEFRTWATARIGELIDTAKALVKHVFGPLATPERLAAWIVGAMFMALLRYLVDNAVPIGRAIWAARTQVTVENLNKAEDIFIRIL